MGFGSYDESEQRDESTDADEDRGLNVHENDHDGEMTVEAGESTDDLVGRLDEMKDGD